MCDDPSNLQVGTAFIYYADDITPAHHKRAIIVGVTNDGSQLAAVYINSDINPHDLGAPELEALHHPIAASDDRPYLQTNSFIDCSRLIHLFPDSLCRNINENGQVYGQALDEDMQSIIDLLSNGGSIIPYYLKYYGIIAA